jgi:MATE family multidrug resistance protein
VLFLAVKTLLRLGLPAALTIGFEIGVFHLVTAIAGTLDPVSMAAHTIALNADAVVFMVPLGISSAAAVSVGRALGAGDPAGARTAGWTAVILGIAFSSCAALCCLLLPRQIAGLYTHDGPTIRVTVGRLEIAGGLSGFR